MDDSKTIKTIGLRLHNFRKMKGISQLDLENLIDAHGGFISRIENGEVNPSKESLIRIANALELSTDQLNYILPNKTFYPADESECEEAKKQAKKVLQNPSSLAYLIDDRKRLIEVSTGFRRLMPKIKWDDFTGKAMMLLILSPYAQEYTTHEDYLEYLEKQLLIFRQEVGFELDDPVYQQGTDAIKRHPIASKIWDKINKSDETLEYLPLNDRYIIFTILGQKIKLNFTREKLLSNPRFEIIEYVPSNLLLKLFLKIPR